MLLGTKSNNNLLWNNVLFLPGKGILRFKNLFYSGDVIFDIIGPVEQNKK
jgi:hypothetical protein